MTEPSPNDKAMINQQHPITPPPPQYQLKRWEDDILNERENVDVVLDCTWKDGYRAGADAELEECCAAEHTVYGEKKANWLRSLRRPSPPSLAKQALEALQNQIDRSFKMTPEAQERADLILRALKRLQELEQNNG